MCRLALMNRAAVLLLNTHLPVLCADLERAMGGDGNGVAALWSRTGAVTIHKGRRVTSVQAAAHIGTAIDRGADWVLFHTRFATSGTKDSRHCHPFRCGPLVLAHNGHAFFWETLADSLGITDSECLTRMWARLKLPLAALASEEGIFVGFHTGRPFVVKGDRHGELTVSFHKASGAILFASQLDEGSRCLFDQTIEVDTLFWWGDSLTMTTMKPRRAVAQGSAPLKGTHGASTPGPLSPAPLRDEPRETRTQEPPRLPAIELAPPLLSSSPPCGKLEPAHGDAQVSS